MEDQGGLYDPDLYRRSGVMALSNTRAGLGFSEVNQPATGGESSPGRISVSTIETWPRFSDDNPPPTSGRPADGNGVPQLSTPGTRDRGERSRSGAMNLLALVDLRIRSRYPIQIRCPHCSMEVVTMITPKRGATVYCGCALMTLIGMCCVPFLLPAMQDIQHFCPLCSQLIGTSTPL